MFKLWDVRPSCVEGASYLKPQDMHRRVPANSYKWRLEWRMGLFPCALAPPWPARRLCLPTCLTFCVPYCLTECRAVTAMANGTAAPAQVRPASWV